MPLARARALKSRPFSPLCATRARGDIYASIVHDINGPLTVISGFLQLINQRMGANSNPAPEDIERLLDLIAWAVLNEFKHTTVPR